MDEFLQRINERTAARKAAERSFEILGETLAVRISVPTEVTMAIGKARMDMSAAELAVARLAAENGDGTEGKTADESIALMQSFFAQQAEAMQILDEAIIECLDPETHEAWARLRDRHADDPLTLEDMFDIADYLIGRIARIPTSAPADSSGGRKRTKPSSTANSSSLESTPEPSALVGS